MYYLYYQNYRNIHNAIQEYCYKLTLSDEEDGEGEGELRE